MPKGARKVVRKKIGPKTKGYKPQAGSMDYNVKKGIKRHRAEQKRKAR